ncbi:alpha-glucoside ABC transporter substrate-binding protein [Streptomyces sp. NPDC001356]
MNRTLRRSASHRGVFRRIVPACCLLLLVALCGGCTKPEQRTLVVLGPWTSYEGKAFEATLKDLAHGTGYTYTYQGTTSISETLVAELHAGSPPDVAILNSIGELAAYARENRLRPIHRTKMQDVVPPWAPEITVHGTSRAYWVPLKVDLKSLVLSKKTASSGQGNWCIGLASEATSGWPGTDWIEDILLHQAGPREYAKWATGRLAWTDAKVKRAWKTWRSILGLDKLSRKTRESDLMTSYRGPSGPHGPQGLLNSSNCRHEHQIGYMRSFYSGDDTVDVAPSSSYLRGDHKYQNDFEVSGDMAAVFSDHHAAQDLIRRLSGQDGRETWQDQAARVSEPGLEPLFPGPEAPQPSDRIGSEIAPYLTDAHTLCFDASDVMPPALRDTFYRAVLEFYAEPSDAQLTRLLEQLQALTKHEEPPGQSFLSLSDICASP